MWVERTTITKSATAAAGSGDIHAYRRFKRAATLARIDAEDEEIEVIFIWKNIFIESWTWRFLKAENGKILEGQLNHIEEKVKEIKRKREKKGKESLTKIGEISKRI